ncbi:MAG: hypothetical protein ACOYOQ_16690 [Microthrixaceae bacterium]
MTAMTPTMRRDLNIGTTWLLPEWSNGPHGDEQAVLEAVAAAGYQGVQGADPERCRALGLVPTTFDVRPRGGRLADRARRWADQGFVCATLMIGTGMEDDDEAALLVEEVLDASTTAGLPLYVETHRATVTQDIWRTLQLVRRFPEIRFNGDFSHWYTGHDLPFGDFDAKLDALAPVLERTRYLHGRVATSGIIQVDIGDGSDPEHPSLAHFRELWTRVFAGFITTADDDLVPAPDGAIGFAPELLPAEFGYALLSPDSDGRLHESTDRWDQALALTRIAAECFTAAASTDGS